MGLINEIYRPQIGFVPIGDRFTMGAKTAALACKRYFEFETVIPCHYGTFPVLDQTADKFVKEMKGNNVVVPRAGVPFEV
jgi:L-ascorbate metabolism protein UlaG (beta-lactamase superfamily)